MPYGPFPGHFPVLARYAGDWSWKPSEESARMPPRMNPYPSSPDNRTHDFSDDTPPDYMHEVLTNLKKAISDFTMLVEDQSHRVNEYQGMSLNGESLLQLTLSPDYDMLDEIIESVTVTGPPTTAFTLNLGKRAWSTLVLPASGILIIAPVRMSLGRNDVRMLTSAVAGNWTLELTGYADTRYRYK